MSKYDRFYPVAPLAEEDTRPLTRWHKLAIAMFALVALWVWLTPDSPAQPIPLPVNILHPMPHRVHTIHIHQRICDMKQCMVVDVILHPRVI